MKLYIKSIYNEKGEKKGYYLINNGEIIKRVIA